MHGRSWDAASSAWENWAMSLQGHSLTCLEVDEDEERILIFGKRQLSHPSLGRARGRIQATTGCQLNFPGKVISQILLEAISENTQDQ